MVPISPLFIAVLLSGENRLNRRLSPSDAP
jgi:hypothetical protein